MVEVVDRLEEAFEGVITQLEYVERDEAVKMREGMGGS